MRTSKSLALVQCITCAAKYPRWHLRSEILKLKSLILNALNSWARITTCQLPETDQLMISTTMMMMSLNTSINASIQTLTVEILTKTTADDDNLTKTDNQSDDSWCQGPIIVICQLHEQYPTTEPQPWIQLRNLRMKGKLSTFRKVP